MFDGAEATIAAAADLDSVISSVEADMNGWSPPTERRDIDRSEQARRSDPL